MVKKQLPENTTIEYNFQAKGRDSFHLLAFLIACFFLVGCSDSVTTHKILSTVFDGVPAYPPVTQMCDEYYTQRVAADIAGQNVETAVGAANNNRSSHKPYAEKQCNGCHSSNKNLNNGLIVPKQELCLVCHKDFILKKNVHGPVAVGDCLACHLPHSSKHKMLLIEDPDKICATCHQESRLAAAMHTRFTAKTIGCGECHDPHSGDARYFLK